MGLCGWVGGEGRGGFGEGGRGNKKEGRTKKRKEERKKMAVVEIWEYGPVFLRLKQNAL